MNENIVNLQSTMKANARIGTLVQSLGRQLRAIGFPTTKGVIALKGTKISFEGCYPNGPWFTINTPEGVKLEIPVRAVQEGPDLQDNPPAIVPIRDLAPFYGLMLIRPVSNAAETNELKINFYFEALSDQRWITNESRGGVNTGAGG